MQNNEPLLQVKNLKTYFYAVQRTQDFQPIQATIKAVDGINLQIKQGTTLGLVGESGCGKTTAALSILNLIPYIIKTKDIEYAHLGRGNSPYARGYWRSDTTGLAHKRIIAEGGIIGGEVLYKGKDLLKMSQEEIRHIRGKEISMIFQNPLPSLHPMEFIGLQVGEALLAHEKTRLEQLRKLVFEYLGKVELKDIDKRYKNAPHLFSGGEGQRIMLAMALIAGPKLLIADEPVKSLDVIVQRQVIGLLRDLKKQFDLSMLLITHDFAVAAELSDYIAFMYSGKIVEHSDVISVYKHPLHPYTRGLLDSIPRIDIKRELRGLKGDPPNPLEHIPGCNFHPRCPYAIDRCRTEEPTLVEASPGHLSACFRANELPEWQG
jgi:oligopeptide/dipeptide ABC transporter ATP-binding protein